MKALGRPLCELGAIALLCGVFAGSEYLHAGEVTGKTGVQKIRLDAIYSTSSQKGLKTFRFGLRDLKQVYREFKGSGLSNVFLVRGDDIATAIKQTLGVLTGNRTSVPIDAENQEKKENYWLVAYVGVGGSEPPAWLVRSVERKGDSIQFVYSRPKPLYGTTDAYQYIFWVPLGHLDEGTYTLELFHAEQMQATIMRRVSVSKNLRQNPTSQK